MRDGVWLAAVGAAFGALLVAFVWWRRDALRARVRDRLDVPDAAQLEDPAQTISGSEGRFARKYLWAPWLIGLLVTAVLYFGLRLAPAYAIAPGFLIGLLGGEVERQRVLRIEARIESQLADAIDLMVGALQAGAGVTAAIESATRETRWPLQPQLAEVLGRIRLGDDPQAVLRGLTRRVPLENFVLFATTLSVHWEVGGSLAPTLSTVGKAIRDRIELARRINSLTAQARASVVAVLLATYFIAVVIWRNNPERMAGFLNTQIGAYLVAFAVLMQAVGIVWSAAASRIRY